MTFPTRALLPLFAATGLQILAGCDAGPYTPNAHRSSDASTGSMLSGTDTGANDNGLGDASLRNLNQSGAPGGH